MLPTHETIANINRLSGEILDLIIVSLSDVQGIGDLCTARLVCRSWNQHAARHLFRTITLYQTEKPVSDDFQTWHSLMGLEAVKNYTQRVIIQTCPDDIHDEPLKWHSREGEWQWPGFTSAIDRIIELDQLQAIEVHFCEWCNVLDMWNDETLIQEGVIYTREWSLRAVYKAIKQRQERRLQDRIAALYNILLGKILK
ncbi:hypothetical protein FPOAC2_10075 [Fusarium poae]|jgi:hypothetical protein